MSADCNGYLFALQKLFKLPHVNALAYFFFLNISVKEKTFKCAPG
jgi:hypothetical protein